MRLIIKDGIKILGQGKPKPIKVEDEITFIGIIQVKKVRK